MIFSPLRAQKKDFSPSAAKQDRGVIPNAE